jgi:hypothetical protein
MKSRVEEIPPSHESQEADFSDESGIKPQRPATGEPGRSFEDRHQQQGHQGEPGAGELVAAIETAAEEDRACTNVAFLVRELICASLTDQLLQDRNAISGSVILNLKT